jgi:hypothetical protein
VEASLGWESRYGILHKESVERGDFQREGF